VCCAVVMFHGLHTKDYAVGLAATVDTSEWSAFVPLASVKHADII